MKKTITEVINCPLFARVFVIALGSPIVIAIPIAALYLPQSVRLAALAFLSIIGSFGLFCIWTGTFGNAESASNVLKRCRHDPFNVLPLVIFGVPAFLVTMAIRVWMVWRRPTV